VGLIDVYRINPADSFSVKSASLKKQQDITYFTLLAKIRGDLNLTSIDSNVDNWNSAYDNVVVSGNVTGYNTKTINLVRRDGSVVSFSFEDLNSPEVDTLDTVTTRGNVTVNTIDVGGVKTDYVQFDTTASPTLSVGMMAWNTTDGTADIRLMGNNVTLQVGQEEVIRVVNKTGSNLLESQYKVVRVRTAAEGGAQGQRLAVLLAQANSRANHSGVLGLVTENINNNQEGFVTAFGFIRNINTTGNLQGESWSDGDALWLSATVAGNVTNIEPADHPVQIGYVTYAHQNNGKIFVKIENGVDELSELHDVKITSIANNQILKYNSFTQRWENVNISSVAATLAFSTIAVSGQFSIVADSTADTLTVAAGTGMSITTNAGTDTLTITNNDRGSSQNIFKNIAVAGQSTVVADSNNDTLTLIAGSNVTITTDAVNDTITINSTGGGGGASGTVTYVDVVGGTGISTTGGPVTTTGTITVTNTDPGSAQNIFKNVAVSGQSDIVADSNNDTLTVAGGTGISLTTNATTDTLTITNSAPDQTVVLTAGANVSITGTYPSFTIASSDQFVGTVTSVNLTAGTGMAVSGGPITTSGSITVTNNDRGSSQNIFKVIDVAGQTPVTATSNSTVLTVEAGTGISVTTNALAGSIRFTNSDLGSAQNIFKNIAVSGSSTIVADNNNDTLTVTAGTGITLSGNATTDTLTITNSAPDQVVSITGAGTTTVSGTYPNFTVTSNDQYVGTVTSVGVTAGTGITVSGSPITSSGSITVTNNDRGSSQNIFKNVAVPGSPTIVAANNNDTFTIKPGSGISATTTGNDITLSNTDPGSTQNIFKNIAVAGQSTIVADSNNDTLTLVAGSNVTLTTNATTDSVTIDVSTPSSATPADAIYQRDYASPFVIPGTWAVVNINSFDIRVSVNKTPADDNRAYFFVTFEVESTESGPQFRMFKYKLYNSTLAADVTDSESYWVGYMYGTSEVPYTTFSFHIPSDDSNLTAGDVIELQVQELSAGTAPNITYAALSYIDAVG
jgi:protein-disulfide isomerase-like protein with CxxC motif